MALVEYTQKDGVAILELNNPPANAYTLESLKQLDEVIVKARFDSNAHVLVIRGAGEKFFSAGADINMLSKESTEFRNQFALFGHETLTRLENTPKLVIAAINGHCVGGGLEIAMACDIRIAKKNAGRTGLAEFNLGADESEQARRILATLFLQAISLPENLRDGLIAQEVAEAAWLADDAVGATGQAEHLLDVLISGGSPGRRRHWHSTGHPSW